MLDTLWLWPYVSADPVLKGMISKKRSKNRCVQHGLRPVHRPTTINTGHAMSKESLSFLKLINVVHRVHDGLSSSSNADMRCARFWKRRLHMLQGTAASKGRQAQCLVRGPLRSGNKQASSYSFKQPLTSLD